MMAFHGSSFLLTPFTAQSKVENRPPQTIQHVLVYSSLLLSLVLRFGMSIPPKFPPRTGARSLIAVMAPIRLSPTGLFRNPEWKCY